MQSGPKRLQRIVLTSFILAFASARIVVLLIMSRTLPDLYLHLGGTHVHHLNYGIFLLSAVGAALLFAPPTRKRLDVLAALYGVGLALTFDEFGMWLHLGGSYWQRASFDAVTIVGAILLLAAFTPPMKYWTARRLMGALVVLSIVGMFFWRLSASLGNFERTSTPELQRIERLGPE